MSLLTLTRVFLRTEWSPCRYDKNVFDNGTRKFNPKTKQWDVTLPTKFSVCGALWNLKGTDKYTRWYDQSLLILTQVANEMGFPWFADFEGDRKTTPEMVMTALDRAIEIERTNN